MNRRRGGGEIRKGGYGRWGERDRLGTNRRRGGGEISKGGTGGWRTG
jgi:hypothetical protein